MNYSKTLMIKLVLYAALIICAFILLIYSGRQYEESVSYNEVDEQLTVTLSYLKTKVMMAERVDVVKYNGEEMLLIDDEKFDNFIFYKDGKLFEITVVNNYQFKLEEAEMIAEVPELKISRKADYLIIEAFSDNNDERLLVLK